jgi:hypothetical protein
MTVEANPLHREYFNWLYNRVFAVKDVESQFSYTLVCDRMHTTIFKVLVPRDENRAADGAELRNEFLRKSNGHELDKVDVMYQDASVFEVLVGLAGRANRMMDLPEPDWFSIFLFNLSLDLYNDEYCLNRPTWRIGSKINVFNDRRYRADGGGGLFPLRRPVRDQRRVELWYQMGAYMTENKMY